MALPTVSRCGRTSHAMAMRPTYRRLLEQGRAGRTTGTPTQASRSPTPSSRSWPTRPSGASTLKRSSAGGAGAAAHHSVQRRRRRVGAARSRTPRAPRSSCPGGGHLRVRGDPRGTASASGGVVATRPAGAPRFFALPTRSREPAFFWRGGKMCPASVRRSSCHRTGSRRCQA